jgi:hypothetical protein
MALLRISVIPTSLMMVEWRVQVGVAEGTDGLNGHERECRHDNNHIQIHDANLVSPNPMIMR